MLNRTPPNKPTNTANVISSYRKRRMQRGPILLYGAIGLIVVGLIVIGIWLFQPDQLIGTMLATDTPTATTTLTPTTTFTPTQTVTITPSPTITLTSTPSEPFSYTVQEGDYLSTIAEKNILGDDGIALILFINPYTEEAANFSINPSNQIVYPNQQILIPNPGMLLPTATPIPANLPRGKIVQHTVQTGDTLAGIAVKYNSIQQNILDANKDRIENENDIKVGQVLDIPVNLVTATAALGASSTPVTPTVVGQPTQAPATQTPATGGSGSTACVGTGNETFVTELQKLINDERAKNNLPSLTINEKLVASAKTYATDMLCKNYLSPIGLDGSTAKSRAAGQGYSASIIVENLYALHPAYGISPQVAFNWWMKKSPESRANILNPDVTEMGITYVSNENTLFGAYFVVTFAKP